MESPEFDYIFETPIDQSPEKYLIQTHIVGLERQVERARNELEGELKLLRSIILQF